MRTTSLLLVLLLTLVAASHGAVANFDDLSEGGFTALLADGGISFSNVDGGSIDQRFFAIDDVSDVYTGAAGFSTPNILTFNAYGVGPAGAGFGRLKSFDFTTGALALSASLTVLSSFNDPDNTITLQGLRNGVVAGSATLTISTDPLGVQSLTLGAGLYDSFHVVAGAPDTGGIVFIGLDNVVVNPVPEPASVTSLCLGALGLLRYRMRRS